MVIVLPIRSKASLSQHSYLLLPGTFGFVFSPPALCLSVSEILCLACFRWNVRFEGSHFVQQLLKMSCSLSVLDSGSWCFI